MTKKKKKDIYCACCRSPRKMRYNRHLSTLNYVQILMLSGLLFAGLFKWIDLKGLIFLPVVWVIFEGIHKSLYRKDLKCPFCGFDPTWYKKDVKLARRKVEEFLKENPDSPVLKRRSGVDNFLNNPQ